jgi:hypothetical protein
MLREEKVKLDLDEKPRVMKLMDFRKTSKFRVEGIMRGHNIKNKGKGNKHKRRKKK